MDKWLKNLGFFSVFYRSMPSAPFLWQKFRLTKKVTGRIIRSNKERKETGHMRHIVKFDNMMMGMMMRMGNMCMMMRAQKTDSPS